MSRKTARVMEFLSGLIRTLVTCLSKFKVAKATKPKQSKKTAKATKPQQTKETAKATKPQQTKETAKATKPQQTKETAKATKPQQTKETAKATKPKRNLKKMSQIDSIIACAEDIETKTALLKSQVKSLKKKDIELLKKRLKHSILLNRVLIAAVIICLMAVTYLAIASNAGKDIAKNSNADNGMAVTGKVKSDESGATAEETWTLEDNTKLLEYLVYAEARGEELKGQVAVAQVVINRATKKGCRNDYREVIFEPNQFETVHEEDNQFKIYAGDSEVRDEDVTDEVKTAVKWAENGADSIIKDYEFFIGFTVFDYDTAEDFAQDYNITDYIPIGRHIFFGEWTKELNDIKKKERVTSEADYEAETDDDTDNSYEFDVDSDAEADYEVESEYDAEYDTDNSYEFDVDSDVEADYEAEADEDADNSYEFDVDYDAETWEYVAEYETEPDDES